MTVPGPGRAALIALPIVILAEAGAAEALRCSGRAPDWSLRVDEATARLVFPAPTEMDVMLVTPAEGREWPRAWTLIGERDTAILLAEPGACDTGSLVARLLTQRANRPILLAGCCERAE